MNGIGSRKVPRSGYATVAAAHTHHSGGQGFRVQTLLFALTLAWTGARVSEVLAVFPQLFQIEACVVSIVTLKRRRFHVREVPIPPELMVDLVSHFAIREAQRDPARATRRLCRAIV
jgi:hypothetical protein